MTNLNENLIRSARRGDLELAVRSLNEGANPDATDMDGYSALENASRNGHRAIVQVLINKGADPNLAAKDGGVPVLAAAARNEVGILQDLLAAGARIDACYRDQGRANALLVAAKYGAMDVVRLLLSRGIDINWCSDTGASVLYFAMIYEDQPEVIAELLALGADPTHKDTFNKTPLDHARALKRSKSGDILERAVAETFRLK